MRADVPSRALLSHDHGPRYPRRHAGDGRQTAEHHPEGGGDAAQSLGRGRAGAALPLEAHPRVGFDQDPSRWDEQNGLDDDERRSNSSAMSAIPRDVRYLACVRLATAPQRGSRAVRDGGPGRRVHARPRLRGPGLRRVLPARLRRPSSRDRPERGGRRRRAARFPTWCDRRSLEGAHATPAFAPSRALVSQPHLTFPASLSASGTIARRATASPFAATTATPSSSSTSPS